MTDLTPSGNEPGWIALLISSIATLFIRSHLKKSDRVNENIEELYDIKADKTDINAKFEELANERRHRETIAEARHTENQDIMKEILRKVGGDYDR
jgi:hypothetical protein